MEIVKLGQYVEIPVTLFDNWKFMTLLALVIILRPLVVYIKNKYKLPGA
jgi:hypothetical protein